MSEVETKEVVEEPEQKISLFDVVKQMTIDVQFFYYETLTICVIHLNNGFKTVGHFDVLSELDYNIKDSKERAYSNALNSATSHYAFLTKEFSRIDAIRDKELKKQEEDDYNKLSESIKESK